MNVKKFLVGISASAVALGTMAVPVLAAPPSYGEQPGYENASACGADHGAFAFFGNFGYVHSVHDVDGPGGGDTGYDEYADGTDDNVGQGAEGGVTGGTGDRNSNSCGNPQHEF